jgi:hypothetical protein
MGKCTHKNEHNPRVLKLSATPSKKRNTMQSKTRITIFYTGEKEKKQRVNITQKHEHNPRTIKLSLNLPRKVWIA